MKSKIIENREHCVLCDNKIVDFNTGALCILTNAKADFKIKCNKIILENELQNSLKKVSVELALIENRKKTVYGHLILYFVLGLIALYGANFFTKYLYELGWISSISILFYTIAIGIIGFSFAPLGMYVNDKNIALGRRNKIKGVLDIYGYDYSSNVIITKKPHDTFDTKAIIKVYRK